MESYLEQLVGNLLQATLATGNVNTCIRAVAFDTGFMLSTTGHSKQ